MTLRIPAPQPKQREFLQARARFIAYGGARGGGKSWAVRVKAALLCLYYPGIRVLLLRRTFPELRENHILPLQTMLRGAARYRETDKSFTFPGGSRLIFGYCASEKDVLQYQGNEYDVIFLDEATQFTEYQFATLTASVRGANTFPKRMYLTCNPGGVGHQWVKRLFVDRDYRPGENPADYAFIRATARDNQALLDRDPGYIRMLENLPDALRRAWLEGDWDIFTGQYFTEFRREKHVCRPFEIPQSWRRYFAMDYGLDMLAGYWIALSPEGRAYVYRELYRSGLIIGEAAELIRQMTAPEEEIYAWFAPPDLWNRRQDTGRSVAEIFYDKGICLTQAENKRVAGWMELHEWLRDGPQGPGLQIFETCPNLIRTLPALQFDEKRPNDAAQEPHELTHGPDALRYFAAGRPRPKTPAPEKEKWQWKHERPKGDPAGYGEEIRVI